MRQIELSDAILDAIEASYYVMPEAPGILKEELVAALADLNFRGGEIVDALSHLLQSRIGWGSNGLRFAGTELPLYLGPHAEQFVDDPRDWETFAFVQESLQTLAREKGVANAKLGISEIILEGEHRGYDRHQLLLGIHGLPLMLHAKIDTTTNTIGLTQQGANWARFNQPSPLPPVNRPAFGKILAAVRREISKRDLEVRWSELRTTLARLNDSVVLTSDELRVLDDLCARFADSGEPSSLDDVLRRLPAEIDVRSIANTNLQDKGLVHAQPDTRVFPSLLAIRRYPELFWRLLLLANDLLKRAREHWDAKEVVVPLVGARGLIPLPRLGVDSPIEVKQVQLLIEMLSFRPCLAPSHPAHHINIKDDIRLFPTLVSLFEHKLRPPAPPNVPIVTQQRETKMSKRRLRMFIGSTVEALPIAQEIQSELDHDFHITLWTQNIFRPGQPTWTELVSNARGNQFDLALLVLGGEDEVTSRGVTSSAPRDNLLLEYGLFTGALGLDRTFFLIDRDSKPKIATDLAGITPLDYSGNRVREDNNIQAAVGAACHQLRKIANKIATSTE